MSKAFTAWKWSLGIVTHSYRTVIMLAVLIALWVLGAYEWLGMPAESSALLMILSLVWAIAKLLVAAIIIGGTIAVAGEAAATEGRSLPIKSFWSLGLKKSLPTLVYCFTSLVLAWLCSTAFDWIGSHSVEVASFLTFHSEKPISHLLLENIYNFIESFLWIIFSGFLLSFSIALLRDGWGAARKQTVKILAGSAFQAPFLTSLLSVLVFGGSAYKLANWHPIVPPGFWDYTQVIVRFSLALVIISAGLFFWSLSLARLQVAKEAPPKAG
jgi:hypothetical protein